MNESGSSALPLRGVVVLELGTSVAAPFGTQILADLGAEVVKVERPGTGDDARAWGPPFWEGSSATFQALNRNKRSISVDIKDEAARDGLRHFILNRVDVVVQNLRPGLAEELGLGSDLLEQKPSLVYCNIGAFGSTGPLRDRPGYDPLMQAFGGIMSVTGFEGLPPIRVGTSIIDMAAGMWIAIGALAALRRRDTSGCGGLVDTSLYETAVAWMTVPMASYLASGQIPGKHGSALPILCPYRAFETADGHLMIAVGTDALFEKLCAALDRDMWAKDLRFATNPARVENRTELEAEIERLLRVEPTATAYERIDAVGVPCAVLQTTEQVATHPQTEALGMLQRTPDGKLELVALPLSFDGHRPGPRSAPPSIGDYDGEYAAQSDEPGVS